jgi:outer membrane protein assembly factor BamB
MENIHLSRFSMTTTQEEWTSCLSTTVMAVDETLLYMWGRESGLVIAYDKVTGEEVWQSELGSKFPTVNAITTTTFGLLVEAYNRLDTRFYLLNPETGEKIDTFQSSIEWLSFQVEHDSTAYVITDSDRVVADGSVQWQTSLGYKYYSPTDPVQLITNDTVVLTYQVSPTIDYIQITALDKTNGNYLWEQDLYIKSKPSILDNYLFLLTENSELVSIDLMTGEIIIQATVTPKIEDISGENTNAIIVADNEQVLVYFASSHQLFEFIFLSDN